VNWPFSSIIYMLLWSEYKPPCFIKSPWKPIFSLSLFPNCTGYP